MKVSICCVVYNHADYLEQTLNSFLSQETTFDFEVVIGEDCSTDNSRAILQQFKQQYPDKIKLVLHDKNVGATANFMSVLNACTGGYFALCDGDDYWDNTAKLQQQVAFLDANRGYSICWTQYKILNDGAFSISPAIKDIDKGPRDITLETIFNPYNTLTLTAVMRREVLKPELLQQLKHFKDNSIYFLALMAGKGRLLNFYGGVYRQHSGGVFSMAGRFHKIVNDYLNYKELITLFPEQVTPNIIAVFRGTIIAMIESYQKAKPVNATAAATLRQAYKDLMRYSNLYRRTQFTLLYLRRRYS